MIVRYDNKRLFIDWCNIGNKRFEEFCDKKHKAKEEDPCGTCFSRLEDNNKLLDKNSKNIQLKSGIILLLFKEED